MIGAIQNSISNPTDYSIERSSGAENNFFIQKNYNNDTKPDQEVVNNRIIDSNIDLDLDKKEANTTATFNNSNPFLSKIKPNSPTEPPEDQIFRPTLLA